MLLFCIVFSLLSSNVLVIRFIMIFSTGKTLAEKLSKCAALKNSTRQQLNETLAPFKGNLLKHFLSVCLIGTRCFSC